MTSGDLLKQGVSSNLAVYYVRSGWLTRLAHGVYGRPNEKLELNPCLAFLQQGIDGFHVGGKTALDWYGVRHYVASKAKLQLYGWDVAKLPAWFTERFPAEYHRKRIFDELPTLPLHIGPFEQQPNAPHVASPERAFLELLSEVGVRETLQEARELAESTYSLRSKVLVELLMRCTNIKTVRLCLTLGNQLSLPWIKKIDAASLPTGSDRPWVGRSADGLLVLKP
jgi:hypothetical protein